MELSCLQDVNEIRAALIRREELLNCNEVPLQSELYKSLGRSLGRVVIDNMTLLSKEIMGVTDPLKGPPKNLWVPPTSSEKKILTPPSPEGITKALIHQGILEIGEEFEAKVEKSCMKKIKRAADDASEFEKFEFERRLRYALDCQQKKHQEELHRMRAMDKAELFVLQNALNAEYMQGRAEYMAKYRCHCEDVVKKTQDQCIQTVAAECREEGNAKFLELTRRQEQLNVAMKCLWEDFKEHLKIQRHVLTCTRVAEVMHVICAQKLDAQQKIHKVKQLCNEELSRIAANNGYERIKEKYLGVMKKIKDFASLADVDDAEHKEILAEFQNQIQRDMLEIEFEENLCRCCLDAKEQLQKSSGENKLHTPAGIVIYPKTYGENVFCTCYSTSEEEDAKLQVRMAAKVPSKERLNPHWSTISISSTSRTSIETKTTDSVELPLDSDLLLTKKIAQIINIEDILVSAFKQLDARDLEYMSNETLQHRIFEYVSEEFHRKFNQDIVLKAITNVTNKRRQSFIVGTRDSVEMLKTKRDQDEFETVSNTNASAVQATTSTSDATSSANDSVLQGKENLMVAERSSEEEIEFGSVEIVKDVLRLSDPRGSTSWKNEPNLRDQTVARKVWKSLVQAPKYMVHPESQVDSNWIYKHSTDEQWNMLVKKYGKEADKEENSSSSSVECAESSSENAADPKLLNKVIEAYKECTKKTSHPLAKMRVRSLIDLLERNEKVTKLLYKNKIWETAKNAS